RAPRPGIARIRAQHSDADEPALRVLGRTAVDGGGGANADRDGLFAQEAGRHDRFGGRGLHSAGGARSVEGIGSAPIAPDFSRHQIAISRRLRKAKMARISAVSTTQALTTRPGIVAGSRPRM